ncbi:MAG: GntR family transcriptional regulator [Clostridia bacterium]|nr:GntR family transcriptional regulator [Clostridia bacterium]
MKWNFSGERDVYLEIAEQYKKYVSLGLLLPGERLPSVRTAAIELGVNPNTVARAYSLLEEEGVVTSIPKKGIYVTDRVSEDHDEEKRLLSALREKGISKEVLLNWIEEVYEKHD